MRGWRTWLAIATLGFGAFTIVTTELAPIGLLSAIATDFGQSESSVGLVVTVYAWVAAVAALGSAVALGHLPRRPLLIGLMLVLAGSSAAATFASTLSALLGARVIGALAHGVFWAMIGTLGAQIAPPHRIGLATSIIFGGVSAASVLGVPLANMISHFEGWRYAFGAVAILAFVTSLAIAAVVPKVAGAAPVGVRALKEAARDRAFLRIYFATACAITAHFAAFTYIEPFLSGALHVPAILTSTLLLIFGVAGLLGNLVTGVLIDRHLKPLVLSSLSLMAICLLAIGSLGSDRCIGLVAVLLFGWGIATAAVFVGFQTWIIREAGDAALSASAIYVAIFNAAIGAGALFGSRVIVLSNLNGVMITAAVGLCAGLVPVMLLPSPKLTNTAIVPGTFEPEVIPEP